MLARYLPHHLSIPHVKTLDFPAIITWIRAYDCQRSEEHVRTAGVAT